MDYLIPEMWVYGFLGVFFVLLIFAFLVRKTSWNYVRARLKQFFTGGRVVEELDQNNIHNFNVAKQVEGALLLGKTTHLIRAKSALRNPDGLIFQVHKDLGPVINPNVIHSSNNLVAMGFRNISHALEFYKRNYFKEEWQTIEQEVLKNPSSASVLINGVEKQIGLSLLSPVQSDQFTMDLSILNNWSNEDVDGSYLQNTIDAIRNEAERRNQKGTDIGRVMTWIFMILALLGGLTFLLVVLQGQGLLGGHQAQQIVTTTSTTLKP